MFNQIMRAIQLDEYDNKKPMKDACHKRYAIKDVHMAKKDACHKIVRPPNNV